MSDPYEWPRLSEREKAEMRGFDPCPDDLAPIPAHLRLDDDDEWMVALGAAYDEMRKWRK
jgi:hypothetical protein